MPWECKLIEYQKGMDPLDLSIGTMFYAPVDTEDVDHAILFETRHLSESYIQNRSHRRPLLVVLPGTCLFCVDGQTRSAGVFSGGWEVSGEAPNITVHPSINVGGLYHGFLQNGIISDDVEGRTYNEEGYEVRK